MSDPQDTSLTPGPAAGLARMPSRENALVAFADCELIGISSTMTLVISRQTGNQQIMTSQVVEGLKTCITFNTIAAHAKHLVDTRPELQGNLEMATSALNSLDDAGMLLKAGGVCTALAASPSHTLPPTRVFVITCDRPAAVERLLDSMLRTGKLSQHNALFLVDDSRDPANREANREAVAKFNLRSAKDMFYVGTDAQQSLIAQLTDQLPAHSDGIRFLLDPSIFTSKKTYGRTRTLCLLLSVGYRALVMDDDILCEAYLPPIREAGVGLGSGGMRQATFYASEQELFQGVQLADYDPLSGHASLLGSTLGFALDKTNNGPLRETQLHQVNAALANVLQADSPILVTQSGALGDAGTAGARWAISQGEETIARLLSAPHGITAALENRHNWLGCSRPSFFKMPSMSQLTGLDNSQLLPPYFPVYRGEDVLFGAMVTVMHPGGLALDYPFCVPHLSIDARAGTLKDPIAVNGDLLLFARHLAANINYTDSSGPEHNLNAIAQEILRMAARSNAHLKLDFRSELARVHAHQLHSLQNQAARTEKFQSEEWQAYLRRGIEDLQQAISVQHSVLGVKGVPDDATEEDILAEFRSSARGFAAALTGWVEIRNVASQLSEEMISSRTLVPG